VSRKYLTNLLLLSSFATIGIGVIGRRYSSSALSLAQESLRSYAQRERVTFTVSILKV
jgi:hypothetical protein